MSLLLFFVLQIFKRPLLAREASRESLKEFLFASLHLMVHEKTSELPEGSGIVRAINAITLRVILEANSTRVLGSVLHEHYTSLMFKSKWDLWICKREGNGKGLELCFLVNLFRPPTSRHAFFSDLFIVSTKRLVSGAILLRFVHQLSKSRRFPCSIVAGMTVLLWFKKHHVGYSHRRMRGHL